MLATCGVSFVENLVIGYMGMLTFVTLAARAIPGSEEVMVDNE